MEDKFTGSKAFLNIPVGIARDKDLLKKPKTILLMGEIVSMLNVTGEFFMSNKKIAQRLGVSTRTVNDYLDILEKKKLINREKVISKENDAIIGRKIRAGAALVKYTSLGWCNELHYPSETHFTTLVKPTSHKKNSIKEQNNRTTNKYKGTAQDAEPPIPYQEIVEYLNRKTGANYKSTTKPTQRLIKARWHEGYRFDDFKKVMDNKAFEWQNDSKMWKYMRPATLFGTKFDDYLNANDLDKTRQKPTTGGYEELLNGTSTPDIPDIPDDQLPF